MATSSFNIGDLEGGLKALNGNKTDYLFIDATSYAYAAKAGWDYAYGKIPDNFSGIVKINFNGGYNIVCTAYRQSSNWGSIIGHVNSNHIPFFYNVNSGTSTLDELALNGKFAGTVLPVNSDLLDAPVGVWSYLGATHLSNTPCSNGLVRVYEAPSAGWTFIYVNDPTNATVTYLNIKTGSGWTGWKKYTGTAV